jgi:hypothetical protein
LAGGPPPSAASALVSGGVLATIGDDVAAAVGSAAGGSGGWWRIAGNVANALYSLRGPNIGFTSENGLEKWLGDVRGYRLLRLSQSGARQNLTGGGVYVLRESNGNILKVGETANIFERSQDYVRLQNMINQSGGSSALEMEVYFTNNIGKTGRQAIQDTLRDALENAGERLLWDGEYRRLDPFLEAGQRFDLRALLRADPNFGQTGWSVPIKR